MGKFPPKGTTTSSHHLDIPLANRGFLPPFYLNVTSSSTTATTNTTTGESTRLQLQRQRLSEHNLLQQQQQQQQDGCGIGESRVFGFKTSATFFASLRSNLRLPHSPPPSPLSTSPSIRARASTSSLAPPSPLSTVTDFITMDTPQQPQNKPAETNDDPLAGVPPLETNLATTAEDKVEALKLIADSVAQMRQTANTSLIYHPLNLSLAIGVLSVLARCMSSYQYDGLAIGMTCAGLLMTALVSTRYFTQGYLVAAEEINWAWLGQGEVVVTKFGEDVIGTVVVEWVSGEARQKRKKAWKGEIKAWTVRLKYRGKGVGSALLQEAVALARAKGADGLEFAEEHANAKRILPSLYDRVFDKREQRARDLLQSLLESSSPGRGARRKRAGSS